MAIRSAPPSARIRSPSSGSMRPTAITGTSTTALTIRARSSYWHSCHGSGPSVKPGPPAVVEYAVTWMASAPAPTANVA